MKRSIWAATLTIFCMLLLATPANATYNTGHDCTLRYNYYKSSIPDNPDSNWIDQNRYDWGNISLDYPMPLGLDAKGHLAGPPFETTEKPSCPLICREQLQQNHINIDRTEEAKYLNDFTRRRTDDPKKLVASEFICIWTENEKEEVLSDERFQLNY